MLLITIIPGQINLNERNITLGIAALIIGLGVAFVIKWYSQRR